MNALVLSIVEGAKDLALTVFIPPVYSGIIRQERS
jgi:hypothetical protein